jgi:tRNA(fMet)-specific endonuclease VapC
VKRLLDTSAYSELGRGHPGVSALVKASTSLLFSAVVAGELMAGFRRGTRLRQNLADLQRFLAQPRVTLLLVSWATADRYSRIAAALRNKGTPIPVNDIWIAAHAMETGADLISFDPHFELVDGLVWIRPDDASW